MKVMLLSLVLLTPFLPVRAEASFLKYLLHTAAQGEAESLFVLGLAHRDGWDGTIKSGSVTAKWHELATEVGDQRPLLVLGLLQRSKDEVLKDGTKAIRFLRLAAEQGDNYAQVILGDMLLEGDGVTADWVSGTELIRKSATAGFAPAQYRLGVIYLVGDQSVPKNDVEALAWFIVAAEAGSKPAQEYRDERTQELGLEVARLAIKRSRELLGKAQS